MVEAPTAERAGADRRPPRRRRRGRRHGEAPGRPIGAPSPIAAAARRVRRRRRRRRPTPADFDGRVGRLSSSSGAVDADPDGRSPPSRRRRHLPRALGVRGLRRDGLHPASSRRRASCFGDLDGLASRSSTGQRRRAPGSLGRGRRRRAPRRSASGTRRRCDHAVEAGRRRPLRRRSDGPALGASRVEVDVRDGVLSGSAFRTPEALVSRASTARTCFGFDLTLGLSGIPADGRSSPRPGSLVRPCAASSPWSGAPPTACPRPPTTSARWCSARGRSARRAPALDVGRRSTPSPPTSRPPTSCCAACPACAACSPRPTWPPAVDAAVDARCGAASPRSRPRLDDGVPRGPRPSRPPTPPCSASRTPPGPSSATASAPPASSASWPGPAPAPPPSTACTSIQVALSALDRLEVRGRDSAGLHLLVARPRPRPRRLRRRAPLLDAPRRRPAVPQRRRPHARRPPQPRLQGGRRDRRAGRQHPRAARRHRRRRAAAPGPAVARRRASPSSATPGGPASASSARPTPTRSTPRRSGRRRGALRHRRPQRRRRQPRRPQGARTASGSPPRSPPTPRSSRPSSSRRLAGRRRRRRGVPAPRSPPSRARSPSPPTPPPPPTGCCSPCGARARRSTSAWPRTPSSWPPSPTASSRRPPLYLRMDGETPADLDNPNALAGPGRRPRRRRGPARSRASSRFAYDGTPLPVTDDELVTAQITTRDIDRGDHPHFLLKEIGEAPASFRKTLRGKLVEGADGLEVHLGDEAAARRPSAPASPTARSTGWSPSARAPRRSPAQSLAAVLGRFVADTAAARRAPCPPPSCPASPCAPTCPTRSSSPSASPAPPPTPTAPSTSPGPGARRSIAIVNRRNSDLTDKADGVLYTSDGRDVEMAVPSTKAFYAQVAAGCLLAVAIAEVGRRGRGRRRRPARRCSPRCATLPDAMAAVLEPPRPTSPRSPPELAPSRRYWAIVGNGPNRIAAQELRIKLSELCYKSIACDVTEDKKHIDLSAEPLILVCAAGLTGSTADDVAKEVAIYRAHKAAPIVIATEGEGRFGAALHLIGVPPTHPQLAFVLSAMAGHLFGYEAALAIDAQARPLREARAAIEAAGRPPASTVGEDAAARACARRCAPPAGTFFDGLRAGEYDGHLEASTAVAAGVAAALRPRHGAARRLPDRARQGRHAGGRRSTTSPPPSPGPSRSSPGRSTPSSTRPRPSPSASAAPTRRCCRCRSCRPCSPPARRATASATARSRRSPTSTRPSPRSSATSATGSRATRPSTATPPHVRRRPGRRRARLPEPQRARPGAAGHQAPVALERELLVARGRRDGRTLVIVPEVKDGTTTGHHAAARALPRPPAGRHGPRRAAGLPRPLRRPARRRHRDRAGLPRGPARRPARRSTCSPTRSSRSPTAGAPEDATGDRRHRRRRGRGRPDGRACSPARRRPGRRLFTDGEQAYAERPSRAMAAQRYAARFAAKEAVLKALGVGLGACRFVDIEVVRRRTRIGRADARAARRRRRPSAAERWRRRPCTSSLTHTAGARRRASCVAESRLSRLRPVGRRRVRTSCWHDRTVVAHRDPRGDGGDRRRRPRAGRGADRPGRRRPGRARPVRMLGGTYGRRVVVVAGKGNNGADGRAAAERLRRRGVRVAVVDAADAPGARCPPPTS